MSEVPPFYLSFTPLESFRTRPQPVSDGVALRCPSYCGVEARSACAYGHLGWLRAPLNLPDQGAPESTHQIRYILQHCLSACPSLGPNIKTLCIPAAAIAIARLTCSCPRTSSKSHS